MNLARSAIASSNKIHSQSTNNMHFASRLKNIKHIKTLITNKSILNPRTCSRSNYTTTIPLMGKLLTNHDNNKINQQIIKNQHDQQAIPTTKIIIKINK